jgi:hypothetical protein
MRDQSCRPPLLLNFFCSYLLVASYFSKLLFIRERSSNPGEQTSMSPVFPIVGQGCIICNVHASDSVVITMVSDGSDAVHHILSAHGTEGLLMCIQRFV